LDDNHNSEFTAGVTGTGSLIGHKESRDGNDYMKVDQFKFSIQVEQAVIHMNNLFNGNKELGEWPTCSMQATGSVTVSFRNVQGRKVAYFKALLKHSMQNVTEGTPPTTSSQTCDWKCLVLCCR
jgi:hypothetical protein